MSSPCYSAQAPVSLSSPSTDSSGNQAFPYDGPATPETDQYAYENILEGLPREPEPYTLQYGPDGYGNQYFTGSPQLGDLEAELPATTAGGPRPERSWLVANGNDIDMSGMANEPFPHRLFVHQHATAALPTARVICDLCERIATITGQPGQLAVVLPVPAYCNECSLEVALDHVDQALRQAVPIPKQQRHLSPSPNIAKPGFECDIEDCTTTCKRLHDLKRHKLYKHRLGKIHYRCNACAKIRYRDDKMRDHCRKHHGQNFGDEKYIAVAE